MPIDLILRFKDGGLVCEGPDQNFQTGERTLLLVLLAELVHVSSKLAGQVDPLDFLIPTVLLSPHYQVAFTVRPVFEQELKVRDLLDNIIIRKNRVRCVLLSCDPPLNSPFILD